jgi:hypothetical protein
MIVKGKFVNFDRPLVLRKEFGDFPLHYECRDGGYVVLDLERRMKQKKNESSNEEYRKSWEKGVNFCKKVPKDFLLFPNFYPVSTKWLRRCDGVWIMYEDPLSWSLLAELALYVEMWCLPFRFDKAREHLKRRRLQLLAFEGKDLKDEEIEEFCQKVDYVLASAVVLGLFGPFKPSELGYVLEESDRRLSVREMMDHSAYAGSLALYEIGPEGQACHMLTSHAYRPVEYENVGKATLMTIFHEHCRVLSKVLGKDCWGALNPGIYRLAVEFAHDAERGKLVFLDQYPDPVPW